MERHGFFRIMQEKIHTSQYCIAYIDFLGASAAMLSGESDKFLNDINNIFIDVEGDFGDNNPFSNKDLFIKIFSDNILFGFKIIDNLEKSRANLEQVINIARDIQNKALTYGYLVRGAINYGDFFINETFVYGKALVEVVKREEDMAVGPRIIVPKAIRNVLPQYFCSIPDDNGFFTLNNYIPPKNDFNIYPQRLLEKLRREKDNEKATNKNKLAIEHYNFCVDCCIPNYQVLFERITEENINKILNQ